MTPGVDPGMLRGPVESLEDARSVLRVVAAAAGARGVVLPDPPEEPEPAMCCGRGCTPCIYTYWFEAIALWRDRVLPDLVTASGPPGDGP